MYAFGRVVQKDYVNGLQTNLGFFGDDFRLQGITTPSLQDLSYTYDDVGNIKFISSSEVEVYTQSFNYDDLGRLVSADETGGFQMSFKYDSIGNLLLVNSSGVVSTYTYGTGASPGSHAVVEITGGGGQSVDCSGSLPPLVGDWIVNSPTLCKLSSIILSLGSKLSVTGGNTVTLEDSTLNLDGDVELDGDLVLDGPEAGINFGGNGGVATQGASPAGTQTLMYDNSGSLTSGFGLQYEYDDENRLKRVIGGIGVIEEYVYDYKGNRVKKVYGDTTTYYFGKDYEVKVTGGQESETIYYYANGELVGRKDANEKIYYYHPDHLGSTSLVTNQSGSVTERTRYYPFGTILTGGLSSRLYTNRIWDSATGQYYYDVRYYNPLLRRFTQADTEIPNVYNPQALNRYSYTQNNPLKYTDPSGHFIQIPAAITGAAGVMGTAIGIGAITGGLTGYVKYTFTVPQEQKSTQMRNAYIATGVGAGSVGGFTGAGVGGLITLNPAVAAGSDAMIASFSAIYTINLLTEEGSNMLLGKEDMSFLEMAKIGGWSLIGTVGNKAGQDAIVKVTEDGTVLIGKDVFGKEVSGAMGETLIDTLKGFIMYEYEKEKEKDEPED